MFKFFEWKYLGYDPKTDQYRSEITIVDDDFTETLVAASPIGGEAVVPPATTALIDIYSRRNLNVAGNLVLLMQDIESKWLDIKLQIEYYQKYIPEYSKYHDQVMGYLIFT